MLKTFFILFFISVSSFLFAQNSSNLLTPDKKLNQFCIDNWTKKDGLPSNSLIGICQSNDGYLWFTSYDGLIRFDGINFKIFNEFNTDVFVGNSVGAIAKDSKGTLWVTTQNGGLVSYETGEFKSYGIDQNVIHIYSEIFVDSKDRIWSSSLANGWFIFENGEFHFLSGKINLNNIDLLSIAEGPDGSIWLGSSGKGLFLYDGELKQVLTENEGLMSNWVSNLHFQDSVLWIGTDKGVCSYVNNKFEQCKVFQGESIKKIISDDLDNIWVATTNGLYRMNISLNLIEHLNSKNGLKNDYIGNLLIDYENNLWINNYKAGFSRLKNSKFIFYNIDKGLSGKIVNSVCEINKGEILLGFDNGFINLIKNGEITEFKTRSSLIGRRIRDIYKDSNNNIWISTYSGLLKVGPDKQEKWYKKETGFPGKYIRCVYEDSKSNIWIGTRHSGIIRINKDNTYTVLDKSKGFGSNLIMSINEDSQGNIIIGTSKGGLNIIENDTTIKILNTNSGLAGDVIFNTYVDKQGIIWITSTGGLSCIKNGMVHSFNINDSIIYSSPFDILEDESGYFWMPSSIGIFKIKKQDLLDKVDNKITEIVSILYDKHDGLVQPECNSTANSLIASDGTFWFPTINGIALIDPQQITINTYEPPVYIQELIIDNQQVNLNENIIIKSSAKRFTFNFTALSLKEPKDIIFRYKLEGFDDVWNETNEIRTISYTNLKPGEYIFKVTACNNDGFWNNEGDQLSFSIKPAIYETIAFFIILFLIIGLLVYIIYRLRVISLLKRQRSLEGTIIERTREVNDKNEEISKQNEKLQKYQNHLEKEIRERTYDLKVAKNNAERADNLKTSFLENLSHEIRTPLNAIVGYSSILEKDTTENEFIQKCIKSINDGSNTLIRIIDSIMYASRIQLGDIKLNKTRFSLSKLMDDINNEFLESLLYKSKEEKLELIYKNKDQKDIEIYSDRDIVNTILFNLVENAVKYTKEGTVEFGLNSIKQRFIEIYVKDSGIGISKENIQHIFDKFRKIESDKSELYSGLGLGLTISESLIKLLEGKLRVRSEPGKGSTFYFMIPYTLS